MKQTLRWGIIGTGGIASTFASQLPLSKSGQLAAVGSRQLKTARTFAEKYGAPHAHGSYEALLADDTVDVIYLSTPHPMHAEWAIAAARAGKHVFCEKPLTMTVAEARQVIAAARKHGVFLMEAFKCRCHPLPQEVCALIRGGAIGAPRRMEASFSFSMPYDPEHRLFKKALGGSAILDLGCYPVSMVRLLAGAANGLPFANPTRVQGSAILAPSGVDGIAAATLEFPGDLLAQISCGSRLNSEKHLRVYGEEGWIHVPEIWGQPKEIHLHRAGRKSPKIIAPKKWSPHLYALEADVVADALAQNLQESPRMSWADSLGNMQVLETWLKQSGVRFP